MLFLFLEAHDLIQFSRKGLGKLKIVNFSIHLPIQDFLSNACL